jgi:hypothetical protein
VIAKGGTRDDIIYRSRHSRATTNGEFLDTGDGTSGQVQLDHEGDDIKGFYSQFQGEVIVGIEACGYTNWFEFLLTRFIDALQLRRAIRSQLTE